MESSANPIGDGERDEILLQYARQKCRDRLRGSGDNPDPLDVIVVGQAAWERQVATLLLPSTIQQAVRATLGLMAEEGSGPAAIAKKYGPHWGVGAGAAGVLIAMFEALGRILGG